MKIVTQCATSQYNEEGEAVSYWCSKRENWITHKKFKEFHPFEIEFSQPYKSKKEFQRLNPKWQVEYDNLKSLMSFKQN